MSRVFNMVGGGGGSLKDTDAILTVTVPTGSTVTMTKGAVTLTPTMWAKASDQYNDFALFVISPSLFDSQNAWTVTATLGIDTASDTVTIGTNKQYNLFLSYDFYFFKSGVGLLNGMTCNLFYPSAAAEYAKIKTDYIQLGIAGKEFSSYGLYFTPSVDLTLYGTLYFDVEIVGTYYDNSKTESFGIGTEEGADTGFTIQTSYNSSGASARRTVSLDISNYENMYYIKSLLEDSCGNIYNIWMTRE